MQDEVQTASIGLTRNVLMWRRGNNKHKIAKHLNVARGKNNNLLLGHLYKII